MIFRKASREGSSRLVSTALVLRAGEYDLHGAIPMANTIARLERISDTRDAVSSSKSSSQAHVQGALVIDWTEAAHSDTEFSGIIKSAVLVELRDRFHVVLAESEIKDTQILANAIRLG